MMVKSEVVASGLVALALIAAGCGGDDEEEPQGLTSSNEETGASGASGATGASGAGALPADVAAEGNEICKEGNKEFASIFRALPNSGPDDEAIREQLLPVIEGQIEDLRTLDDSEELQSVLDDAEDFVAEIEADPQLFFDSKSFEPINDDFRALGLTVCAES